jgi:hypothetical protein
MKSFSKNNLFRVAVAFALTGGVVSTSSVAEATSCDASIAEMAASSQQPTSLTITGTQVSRAAMNTLWTLTTSDDSEKFRTLGHVIGAAHNWMGDCTYPGLGIGNGSGFDEDTKNVTLWLWRDGINLDLAREAVYQLIGEGESDAVLDVRTRTLTNETIVLSASRTMTSFQSRSFSWDLDGDGTYELSTGTTPSVSASWSTVGVHTVGVKVSRSSGVSQTAVAFVEVLPAPNGNTPGVSILNGQARTSSRDVSVSMVWPAYATAALVSNDGAFSPMHTTTVDLSDSFDWSLEDAGDGVYSTAVYLRFIGAGIDPTRTYIDTIVLDRSPTTTTTTTTVPATTTTTTTPPSNAVVQSVSTRGAVSSMSVRSLSAKVARSSQQVTTKVLASSRAVCRLAGGQVLAIRSGQCRVMVTVRTTNGRTVSRVVTFLAQR